MVHHVSLVDGLAEGARQRIVRKGKSVRVVLGTALAVAAGAAGLALPGLRRIKPVSIAAYVVMVQAAVIGAGAIAIATGLFRLAQRASVGTPIPLETTPDVHRALCALLLLCTFGSALLAIRVVARADPSSVFSS